jgi:DNA-binding GntR family transcriptional regulator
MVGYASRVDQLPDLSMRIRRVAQPVRSETADQIREAIVRGRFEPGQRLIERELTELIGVSRTTIREALQQLTSEGLVDISHGKGWFVAFLEPETARDLYSVRARLEGLAGRLFAERASEDERSALRAAYDEIVAAEHDVERWAYTRDHFYVVFLNGCRSEVISSMIIGIHARASTLRSLALRRPGRDRDGITEIGAIVDAIERGDADAAERAATYHIEQASRILMEEMAPVDTPVIAASQSTIAL